MPEVVATDINDGVPLAIEHIIGQRRAVEQLRISLEAYYADRGATNNVVAHPHVLLVGPAGVGKSLLAQVTARELGGNLHQDLAQNLLTPGHLHGLMMLVENSDCVFLDELHELNPFVQTALYRCLEDRSLFIPSTPFSEGSTVALPPFTFVGATTHEFALSRPLRDRFKLVLRLDHYSVADVTEILSQRSRRLNWPTDPSVLRGIAQRGRGTPRLALRLLEATRRTARSEGAEAITAEHFSRTCEVEGIDGLGLDCLEQRYLTILAEASHPVRLNVLAMRLGLPRQTLERVIESDLIRLGLITKCEAGRSLTPLGDEHLNLHSTSSKTV